MVRGERSRQGLSVDRALPRNLNGVGGRLHARLSYRPEHRSNRPFPLLRMIQDVIIRKIKRERAARDGMPLVVYPRRPNHVANEQIAKTGLKLQHVRG
jgi:hypothetical protein